MKKISFVVLAIAVTVMTVIGFSIWQTGQASQITAVQTATDSATNYQTTTARTGSIAVSVTGAGSVVASNSVDLGFSVSGQVAEINVQLGDRVKTGQVLASLDDTVSVELKVKEQEVAVKVAENAIKELTTDANAALAQALFDQSKAETAYEQAKNILRSQGQGRCEKSVTETYYFKWLDLQGQIRPWQKALEDGNTGYGRDYILERLRPMLRESYLLYTNYTYCQAFTEEEIETSQANLALKKAQFDPATRAYENLKAASGVDTTALEIAKAELKNAQLQLATAKDQLTGTQIIAPMNGTVTALNGNIGDMVNTGAFISLADQEHSQVLVNIDETDLQTFAMGSPAQIIFDSLPGQTFTGTVSQILPTLVTVQNASVMQGLIDLDNNKTLSGKYLPIGLTASVEATFGQSDNTLVIAEQGLYQPVDGSPYVYILNGQGNPEKREVEIGLKTAALVEIKSGLQAGDRVIISNVENL